ncbi:hypothetical protein Acr_10g0007970 [Actinidia rufa]|uniref:Transposase MuDR plant domain-containing protein n=1 Tax=Actinidia rufa TaxID=165716 RepID=A0A7J0F9N0_9ERIC|nr:hypothetical protein Acr_10g0007970 [Actinidia rufa]
MRKREHVGGCAGRGTDGRTLQNVLNIPSRHPDHQYVEIYDVKEEGSTMNTSGSHAASSRSTLAEEAPGQRMCSLFSQGECIEAGGASGSVDPVERLVALGETGTQDNEDADVFQSDNLDEDIDVLLLTNEANDDFDDDRHEYPNICEALHDNPHIPFFMNLVGADDVVVGRDLYDSCPTWSDVTPEFAKGMVFKDKDAVIRACNCHNCPWKLRACLKKQHGFFEIKQYPGPHTCLHGMESLDHRNINSTFIAHLIKTQVAVHENVGVEKPWDSCDFRNIGLGMEGVTLISDRHAAIISAVKHEWETTRLGQLVGIHRYCLRHFRRTNSESAAREYRALCNEDPRKWILAHDGGYRWGVTTTNDSECYNNVLRGARNLPITSCVEVTFYRLVVTFNDKRRQIESALAKGLRYTSKVQVKLEEYQARSAGHHVTIYNWASGSAEVVTSAAGMTGNNKHAVCRSEKKTLVHRLVVRFQATRRLKINPQLSMSCVRTRTQSVTNGMAENVALLTNLSSCTILWVRSATSSSARRPYVHPLGSQTTNALGYQDLFDKRCEQEMYCRWLGLRVPKARSATLFGRGSPNSQVIKALEREINEMQRR